MRTRILSFAAVLLVTLACAIRAQDPKAGADDRRPAQDNPATVVDRARAAEEREARVDAEVTDLVSFAKWAKAARQERIQSLYQRRETIRAEKGNSRFKRDRIEKTNEEIARINHPAEPYVPHISANKVITLDDLSATRYVQVLEIVDDQNARVKFVENWAGGKQLEFFLTGTATAGWVDGQKLSLDGVLIADGSRSYLTNAGEKRTIALMKHHAIPKADLNRRDDMRTWTMDSGTSQSGALVLYEAGKVTIMDMDGKASTFKLIELSAADREYVGQHAPTPPPRKSSKRATNAPDAGE